MSYLPFVNTYVTHNNIRYTFYWYSLYADHILKNQSAPTHGVNFATIVKIVRRAAYVEPLGKKGEHCYRFVTDYEDRTYETYAYLLPQLGDWPPRCVVITCYKNGTLRHKLGL